MLLALDPMEPTFARHTKSGPTSPKTRSESSKISTGEEEPKCGTHRVPSTPAGGSTERRYPAASCCSQAWKVPRRVGRVTLAHAKLPACGRSVYSLRDNRKTRAEKGRKSGQAAHRQHTGSTKAAQRQHTDRAPTGHRQDTGNSCKSTTHPKGSSTEKVQEAASCRYTMCPASNLTLRLTGKKGCWAVDQIAPGPPCSLAQ